MSWRQSASQAIELLLCAADLAICGEEDPTIVAATELDIPFGGAVWNLAYQARAESQRRRHNLKHYVTCLEAAYRLQEQLA